MTPPNALEAANPTSSSRMSRTFGAPFGGRSGSIGGDGPVERLVGDRQAATIQLSSHGHLNARAPTRPGDEMSMAARVSLPAAT
jgi:hypothetical protein